MTKYSLQKEANLIKQKYMKHKTAAQNIKNKLKSSTDNETTEELRSKTTRWQFYRNLGRPSVNKEISLAWLCSSGMKGETESVIIASQYQPLKTYYRQMNIMKQTTDSKCRMCCKTETHKTYC
jgi:hypothetical protein